MPQKEYTPQQRQLEGLLDNEDFRSQGIDIHTLNVPRTISDQWLSESMPNNPASTYPVLADNVPRREPRAGDLFNVILMNAVSRDRDLRFFQFAKSLFTGYVRGFETGIRPYETLERAYLKPGFVYRLEAVAFSQAPKSGTLVFARPLWLVIGSKGAVSVDHEKFEPEYRDRFLLKVLNRDNRARQPFGKYLKYQCFVMNGKDLEVGENVFVQVRGTDQGRYLVQCIQRHVSDGVYEHCKKMINPGI